MQDRHLIYLTAFVRASATGLIGVVLGVHLAQVGLTASTIGIIISAGLAGAAMATTLATFFGDRLGRRQVLILLSVLSTVGAFALLGTTSPYMLGVGAFVGMVNGMGRDRSAASMLEQAILPETVGDAERTATFARYNVLQDAGHALGGLAAGAASLAASILPAREGAPQKMALLMYLVAGIVTGALYLRLNPSVIGARRSQFRELRPESRAVLTRICALFSLDSLGGGFLTTSLIAYFFYERFGVHESTIGGLFFLARVANALSHLGAAWLARHIGLVNTMVFTHIPSSLLLVTVAYAPNFWVAALLFLLREGLVEMDVPTRQSYVMAVVKPEERTFASGVTNLVRVAAWAVAPAFAGFFMQENNMMFPLLVGAAMKISYDVLLYRAFRSLKPPEEVKPRS